MKLSILLPTHNRADVLPFAIESVLAQTFTDFELLVCGDGCTDATAEVVGRYVQADPRVRWFDYAKGPGFGYANRNRALREAKGELIGFMAHDDLVTPDHYAAMVAVFADPEAQLAWSKAVWVGLKGQIVPAVFTLEDRVMRDEFLAGRWNRLPACSYMHRRTAFDDVGYWNEEIANSADLELWRRIITEYGVASVRQVPLMTCLHFRAHWRMKDMAPDEEPGWQMLHHEPGRLPEAMHWPVPEGMREQEHFWRTMVADPESIHRLRLACGDALTTFAWFMEMRLLAQGGLGGWEVMEQKIARLRGKVAGLKGRLAERDQKMGRLQAQLAAARKPRGWWRRLLSHWRGTKSE